MGSRSLGKVGYEIHDPIVDPMLRRVIQGYPQGNADAHGR